MKLRSLENAYDAVTHFIGKITKKYYFEDYLRVYPDQMAINKLGLKRKYKEKDRRNYLNHSKFYRFVAQFASGKKVADIGCGSGYGAKILKEKGASAVKGCDISKHSISFAKERYSEHGEFSLQEATRLKLYKDAEFDLSISSEVLEHIKEYGRQQKAVDELKRITKPGGLIIIGTPNSEMLGDHGFSIDEIRSLMQANFKQFCIFENALVPFGERVDEWYRREKAGNTGVVVSQRIIFEETVLPANVTPAVKEGLPIGTYQLGDLSIDTSLLHNTHSWIVVAVNG